MLRYCAECWIRSKMLLTHQIGGCWGAAVRIWKESTLGFVTWGRWVQPCDQRPWVWKSPEVQGEEAPAAWLCSKTHVLGKEGRRWGPRSGEQSSLLLWPYCWGQLQLTGSSSTSPAMTTSPEFVGDFWSCPRMCRGPELSQIFWGRRGVSYGNALPEPPANRKLDSILGMKSKAKTVSNRETFLIVNWHKVFIFSSEKPFQFWMKITSDEVSNFKSWELDFRLLD